MAEGQEIAPSEEPEDGVEKIEVTKSIEIPPELVREAGGKDVVNRIIRFYTESFSGPVPHPRIIAQYMDVLPDAPERIFKMAEKQQDHRMGLENMVIGGDVKRADLGLRLGFVIFAIVVVGAVILLALGKDIAGYITLGTGLSASILNFIWVGSERRKEREKPKPIIQESRKTRRKKKKR